MLTAEEAADLDLDRYDPACVGVPSYRWHPPKPMDDFFLGTLRRYQNRGRVRVGAPTVPGKHVLVFCIHSGQHAGLREATPAPLCAGQFFEHLGYAVLGEWCVVGEFHGDLEASTLGRLGDIRGRPNEDDLRKLRSDAAQLSRNLDAGPSEMVPDRAPSPGATPRVRLRVPLAGDVDTLVALWTDPDVTRFMGGPRDPDEIREGFSAYVDDPEGHASADRDWWWTIVEQDTGQVAGLCSLVEKEVAGQSEIEVGYYLLPAFWGRGYATEAATVVAAYARSHLHVRSLVAIIDPQNAASARVARKLGMAFERNDLRPDGVIRHIYRIDFGD